MRLTSKFISFTVAHLLDQVKLFVPSFVLTKKLKNVSFLYQISIRIYLTLLNITQHLEPELIKYLQEVRLRRLFKNATKSKWWGQGFKDWEVNLNSKDIFLELKKIPVTQKKTFFGLQPQLLCTRKFQEKDVVWRRTSGTSGMPIKWALDLQTHFIECGSYHLRTLGKSRFPIEHNLHRKFIAMVNHYDIKLHHLGLLARDIQIKLDISSKSQEEDLVKKERLSFYQIVESMHPVALFGATTNLWYLAQKVRNDLASLKPEIIIFTGDTMTSEMRSKLQTVFNSELTSFYGSQEVPAVGFYCDAGENIFHLNAEHSILEILKENNMPVSKEEIGDIVLTCLSNKLMPIIRYKVGDRGRFVTMNCSCNVKLPQFELFGRDYEFIIHPTQGKIPARYLHKIVLAQGRWEKVRQYQVQQISADAFRILIIPTNTWENGIDDAKLKNQIYEKFKAFSKTEIVLVDNMPQIGRKHKSFLPLEKENTPAATRQLGP